MQRGYQPILPAFSGSAHLGLSARPRRGSIGRDGDRRRKKKRIMVRVACNGCRAKKVACDGRRPACTRCRELDLVCEYISKNKNETQNMALKRQLEELQSDLKQQADVLEHLRSAPEAEAVAIIRQLKSTRNVSNVFSSIGDNFHTTTRSFETEIEGLCSPEEVASSHLSPLSTPEISTQPSSGTDGREGEAISKASNRVTSDSRLHPYFFPGNAFVNLATKPIENETHQSSYSDPLLLGSVKDDGKERQPNTAVLSEGRYWFSPLDTVKFINIHGSPPAPPRAIPIHAVQIANSTDTRYISTRYTDFVSETKALIEDGFQTGDLLGPIKLDPSQLLGMTATTPGAPTLIEWAAAVLQDTCTDHMCVEEKFATMLLIVPLVRWQISPTSENYDGIAACMKPTPFQSMISHPAWIDYVPWPEVRDYFITSPTTMEGEDALLLLLKYSHISWPEHKGSIVSICPIFGTLLLSDAFEAWATNVNNWSLDRAILAELPELADKAWIKGNEQSDKLQRDTQFFLDNVHLFRDLLNDQML